MTNEQKAERIADVFLGGRTYDNLLETEIFEVGEDEEGEKETVLIDAVIDIAREAIRKEVLSFLEGETK
jgi:hypothetical protein